MPPLNLYTLAPMKVATITNSPSEATGYPIEYAFDKNPDTSWKPGITGNIDIDIDMGSAVQVDEFALWIKTTNTNHYGVSTSIIVYTDNADDGLYTATTIWGGITFPDSTGYNPIQLASAVGSATKRYWRIRYLTAGTPTTVEFSGFYFLRKRTISMSEQIPRQKSHSFANKVTKLPGGREFVKAINSQVQLGLNRTYKIGSTDFTSLKNAFYDSQGNLFPMIVEETGLDTMLAKFPPGNLDEIESVEDLWDIQFKLKQLPYTPDGSNY